MTLSLGATLAPAGVATTGTAAWVAFDPSIQTGAAGWVGAAGILIYTAGLVLVRTSWQALVDPPFRLDGLDGLDGPSTSGTLPAPPGRHPTFGDRVLALVANALLARPRRRS
ncbi:hypothetical protein [uncultured Serinicoccus sp.]|uniref:hypothetical protein n=1 Tax=uncultured Serinicoccus sp. TaxID=735514 RepID=UPI00261C889F|nr:hypothetical protein [uncultured Serinicoccus sp.]